MLKTINLHISKTSNKYAVILEFMLAGLNKKFIPLPKEAKKIVVLSYGRIGDFIMSIPFLRIIKYNYPYAEITFISRAEAEIILSEAKCIDKHISINANGYNFLGMKKICLNIIKFIKFVFKLREKQYDIAICDRGSYAQVITMKLINPQYICGYDEFGSGKLMTTPVTRDDNIQHYVEDKINMLSLLGLCLNHQLHYPTIELSQESVNIKRNLVKNYRIDLNRVIIGIHPGASVPTKIWTYYDDLINLIFNDFPNVFFVVFAGPGEEHIVNSLVGQSKATKRDVLVVKESLKNYMIVLDTCDMIICNDSGSGHISAALGKLVVSIFGNSYPELYRPYSKNGIYFSNNNVCKGCFKSVCENGTYECLRSMSAEYIYANIKNELKQIYEQKEVYKNEKI